LWSVWYPSGTSEGASAQVPSPSSFSGKRWNQKDLSCRFLNYFILCGAESSVFLGNDKMNKLTNLAFWPFGHNAIHCLFPGVDDVLLLFGLTEACFLIRLQIAKERSNKINTRTETKKKTKTKQGLTISSAKKLTALLRNIEAGSFSLKALSSDLISSFRRFLVIRK